MKNCTLISESGTEKTEFILIGDTEVAVNQYDKDVCYNSMILSVKTAEGLKQYLLDTTDSKEVE